eukprot:gene8526-11526_t
MMFRRLICNSVKRPFINKQLFRLLSSSSKTYTNLPPSNTTSVLLHRLPTCTTIEKLTNATLEVRAQRVELEPGCTLHVLSEVEALLAGTVIKEKFDLQFSVKQARLPSVTIQNVPSSISHADLERLLSENPKHKLNPKQILVLGSLTAEITASTAEQVHSICKILDSSPTTAGLKTLMMKSDDSKFIVAVNNFNYGMSKSEAENLIKNTLKQIHVDLAQVRMTESKKPSLSLRFSDAYADILPDFFKSLKANHPNDIIISEIKKLKKPVIILNNMKHIKEEAVLKLFENCPKERIQMIKKTKDSVYERAIVYFSSEEEALKQYTKVKNLTIDGKRLGATYRNIAEPAVRLNNIPNNYTDSDIIQLFGPSYDIVNVTRIHPSSIRVSFTKPSYASLAVSVNWNRLFEGVDGADVTAEEDDLHDIGIEIFGNPSSLQFIEPALKKFEIAVKNVAYKSNVNVVMSFLNLEEASQAYNYVISKAKQFSTPSIETSLPNTSLFTVESGVTPSYMVQFYNMSPSIPVNDIIAEVNSHDLTKSIDIIKSDRSGLVKFIRNSHVLSGMKLLKQLKIDGESFKVIRYRQLLRNDDIQQYDQEAENIYSKMDRFSLKLILKDFLHASPAERYMIARNAFERTLEDAIVTEEAAYLLGDTFNLNVKPEVIDLIRSLKDQETPDPKVVARLFELFIQREDMRQFTHDFDELAAHFGPADEGDLFNWSQFKINVAEDLENMLDKMKEVENERVDEMMSELKITKKKNVSRYIPKPTVQVEDPKLISVNLNDKNDGSPEEIETVSLEDPAQLKDRDSNIWSGCILDTDIVQKTLPGNRMNTHRVLVVVGNLRGSCGFGMGKGKGPPEALNAAFRDALRNLVHIDLYDNFGLAHDVHGKHNSCQVYIRATPRSREMVCSPLAEEILTRFGIGTVSMKIVGRRNPYSQVRAIFKAISKHENIDETAKNRGKRYLTLKWAHENNV